MKNHENDQKQAFSGPNRNDLIEMLMLLEFGMDSVDESDVCIEHCHSMLQSFAAGAPVLDADREFIAKIHANAAIIAAKL